jgi:hypothetical protein
MSKPNLDSTVKQMKDYIREKKLNPAIKLSLRRGELIEALRKAGHWDTSADPPPTPKKSTPKKPTPKKPTPKKPTPKKPTPKKPMETKKKPTAKWNPLESENAPMNKWVPCTVFNLEGKYPKPYECQYVYQTHMYDKGVNDKERPKSYVVWIKDSKGHIIAAGDMGHLDYDSNKRVTQFRFSDEVITIGVTYLDENDVGESGGLNRIVTNNENHRLISTQPKKIQDYYKTPQSKKIIGMGDFVYDIVRKIKFKKVGGWSGKLKPLTTIPKMLYRK